MKRPKLSKTKQLRRDLRAAQSALDFQTDRAARIKTRADATIQQLEQRLQSLCGALFNYNHARKAFHACIYIDRQCLEYGASSTIHSAVMQLVKLIYREDFQDRTLNMKHLLEDVSHLAGQEFDHQISTHIREIARNHPAGEPPISNYTYFSLAKQFLKAFLQMAEQATPPPSTAQPFNHRQPR